MVDMTFGKATMDAIEAMKEPFGVKTSTEVVSKALALAKIIAREADDDHTVLLAAKDGTAIKLNLAG